MTPVAVITPKGTEFIVQVLVTGEMVISVISGAVTISLLGATSGPVSISAPDSARVLGIGLAQGGVEPPSLDEGIEILVRLDALETKLWSRAPDRPRNPASSIHMKAVLRQAAAAIPAAAVTQEIMVAGREPCRGPRWHEPGPRCQGPLSGP